MYNFIFIFFYFFPSPELYTDISVNSANIWLLLTIFIIDYQKILLVVAALDVILQ